MSEGVTNGGARLRDSPAPSKGATRRSPGDGPAGEPSPYPRDPERPRRHLQSGVQGRVTTVRGHLTAVTSADTGGGSSVRTDPCTRISATRAQVRGSSASPPPLRPTWHQAVEGFVRESALPEDPLAGRQVRGGARLPRLRGCPGAATERKGRRTRPVAPAGRGTQCPEPVRLPCHDILAG